MNPSLDEQGFKDAEVLADYFSEQPLSAIFYSDKKRSAETADIISSKKPGVPCIGTPNLWAWNVGNFSGQPKNAENKQKLEYFIQNPDIPVPGGESLNSFKQRIRPCIVESLKVSEKHGAPTLNVVHSSVVHELGQFINGSTKSALVLPGGIAAVYIEDGKLQARPLLKPDDTRINSKADVVS